MEFISGKERGQYYMGCLDDSIDENNPVRFVDAYVSQLDVSALGFQNSMPQETGRPAYSPKDLLKLYIYGYLNRVRSSRGLEKECYRNIPETVKLPLQKGLKAISGNRMRLLWYSPVG